MFTFITIIWLMILAVAAFLISLVPSLQVLFKENGKLDRILMSGVQATVAVVAILLFIYGLSKLKSFYAARKFYS